MRTEHDRKRRRKQIRKRTLRNLRQRLAETSDPNKRRRLIARMQRVSRTAPVPEE